MAAVAGGVEWASPKPPLLMSKTRPLEERKVQNLVGCPHAIYPPPPLPHRAPTSSTECDRSNYPGNGLKGSHGGEIRQNRQTGGSRVNTRELSKLTLQDHWLITLLFLKIVAPTAHNREGWKCHPYSVRQATGTSVLPLTEAMKFLFYQD
jgi:hypothetical protein